MFIDVRMFTSSQITGGVMMRFKAFLLFGLLISITCLLAVNAPRQVILFFNVEKSFENFEIPGIKDLVERAVFQTLDSETNVVDIDSRFNYNFYPNDPILAVEFAVIASRVLGIEKDAIRSYPLEAPTFEDVRTELEKAYMNNMYDFSRNFGYLEYVQSYMKEKYGFPLIDPDEDGNVDPLRALTKIEVVKGLVRLFTALSIEKGWSFGEDGKNLVDMAEEITSRLKGYPKSGIREIEDAGYLSIFEKMFLTSVEKGKCVSVVKLPYFASDRNFHPTDPAPRWWAISLVYYLFSKDPEKVEDDDLIPVRVPNNLVVYLPKKSVSYEPAKFSLPDALKTRVKDIEVSQGGVELTVLRTESGDIVLLDNTKVKDVTKYIERGGVRTEIGEFFNRDFVTHYMSLVEKSVRSKKTWKVKAAGRINLDEGKIEKIKYYEKPPDLPEVELPTRLNLDKSAKLVIYKVELGTVDEIKKFLENPSEVNIKEEEEKGIEEALPGMVIDFEAIVTKEKLEKPKSKEDYKNAAISCFPVYDRLNMERKVATFDSLKKFVKLYSNEYEPVNAGDGLEFIDYWKKVVEKLDEMGVSDDATVAGKVTFFIEKDLTASYKVSFSAARAEAWMFYVGKLLIHEPATKRLMTQKYVEPLEYTDDTMYYIIRKDGTTEYGKLVENPNVFFDKEGLLGNYKLWYQLTKEGDKLKITYIIAEEISEGEK